MMSSFSLCSLQFLLTSDHYAVYMQFGVVTWLVGVVWVIGVGRWSGLSGHLKWSLKVAVTFG